MNHKRIILVGPSAAGKSFIKEKFISKGFKPEISYTTRKPREREVDKVDYNFISYEEFQDRITYECFYEWAQYGENFYGTGTSEWNNCDIFIMETGGVSKIKPEDRKDCLVIYINTPLEIRLERMSERGWDNKKKWERIQIDYHKFKDFKDYDLEISSEEQWKK